MQGKIDVQEIQIAVRANRDHTAPLAEALNEIRESGKRIISVLYQGSLFYTVITEEVTA